MSATMGNQRRHVVIIPFPAQGHVMPLMKLSYCLADRGFKVTFVNTESIHAKLMDALPGEANEHNSIDMVAIPDGLTPEERNNTSTFIRSYSNNLRPELEKLIKDIMEVSNEKITCVIADVTAGWALEVAMKMGIRRASLFPASAAVNASLFNIPTLIDMGVFDENGVAKKNETILLSPTMPAMETTKFAWALGDSNLQQQLFHTILKNHQISQSAHWLLCNSSYELEHAAISLVPNLIPIGPLLASNQLGNFWPQDSTCISWLSQQAPSSVIYIAFGSVAILSQHQLDELAIGLELLCRPFLWVIRLDGTGQSTPTLPDRFQDKVAHFGKIVSWAPQQKVLAHPSIACFISHCGWNSTLDGVTTGVPFISWPSFSDQFCNATYITDIWKVGLGLNADEDGVVSKDEIRKKVDQLLADEVVRENALKLKEKVISSVGHGGSSVKNFDKFVEEIRS